MLVYQRVCVSKLKTDRRKSGSFGVPRKIGVAKFGHTLGKPLTIEIWSSFRNCQLHWCRVWQISQLTISWRLEFPTFAAQFISDFTIFRCFWSFFSHNQSLITSYSSAVCGYHAPINHRWATNEETLRELAGFITIGIRKGRHVQGIGTVENKGPNRARSGQALSRQEISPTVWEIERSSTWNNQLSWLVVWTPLKNMKVSWDYYSQYMEK